MCLYIFVGKDQKGHTIHCDMSHFWGLEFGEQGKGLGLLRYACL